MREMTTDRPDKTESPYTVDAGHLQFELDLLSYGFDRRNSEGMDRTINTFAVVPVNFKIGLTNKMDFEVVVAPYNAQRTSEHDPDRRETTSGVGDIVVRWKTNFWGDDHGSTAFGVLPFLKLPTNQNHLGNGALEAGIIFPLAIKLPGDWDLGAMTEVDYLQNSMNADYHEEFVNSITASHSIIGKLEGYLEFFSAVST